MMSTDDLSAALATGIMEDSIIFTPTPFCTAEYVDVLLRHIEQGGRVVFYGPVLPSPEAIGRLLNLQLASGLDGDCEFYTSTQRRYIYPFFR
ncbi:MAG: hypothetical protein ACOX44_17450 [Limnochordia bacterium]